MPAGATASFGCKFIQVTGLAKRSAVGTDGDAPAIRIADLSVVPGFTPLDGAGVPFEYTVFLASGLQVVRPDDDVLRSHEGA